MHSHRSGDMKQEPVQATSCGIQCHGCWVVNNLCFLWVLPECLFLHICGVSLAKGGAAAQPYSLQASSKATVPASPPVSGEAIYTAQLRRDQSMSCTHCYKP